MPYRRKSPHRTLKRRSSGKAFANGRVTRRSSKRNTYKGVDGPIYRGRQEEMKTYLEKHNTVTVPVQIPLGSDVLLQILEEVSKKSTDTVTVPVQIPLGSDVSSNIIEEVHKYILDREKADELKQHLTEIFTEFERELLSQNADRQSIQTKYVQRFKEALSNATKTNMKKFTIHYEHENQMWQRTFTFKEFLENPGRLVLDNIVLLDSIPKQITFE